MEMILILICVVLLAAGQYIYDHHLHIENKTIAFDHLPDSLDGLRIVHLSDLHGVYNPSLEQAVQSLHPDIIVCSGDMYDAVQSKGMSDVFLDCLSQIAPVYLVSGNHELSRRDWSELKDELSAQSSPVHFLDNACQRVHSFPALEICGISDPDEDHHWSKEQRHRKLEQNLACLPEPEKGIFRIGLFHRGDLASEVSQARCALLFCGHLHGGQVRLFGRGLVCPNNGEGISFFPNPSRGIFENADGTWISLSAGLGDHMLVPRLFNPPEVICITLKKGI